MCGGIAYPEMVKKYRDGRVMLDRQKNSTRDVGSQYIRWFDEEPKKIWCSDSETPVLLLTRFAGIKTDIQKETGKLEVLSLPIRPEELRNTVVQLLDNGGMAK